VNAVTGHSGNSGGAAGVESAVGGGSAAGAGTSVGAGSAAPRVPARREYVLGLLLGAVGAGVVLLSARQGWAHVLTPAPAPLPASSVTVSGQDLVPLAGALALAALAGLAAVAATRGRVRRFTGLVLAVFGLAMLVSVGTHMTTAGVLAASHTKSASHAGSATAGGTSGVAPGAIPGATTPGVTATGHVTFADFPWQDLALAGALLVTAAGLLTAWRGGRWPAMSSRYERAPQPPPGPTGVAADDTGTLWDALSRGADPTERPDAPTQRAAAKTSTEGTNGTAMHGRANLLGVVTAARHQKDGHTPGGER
jgi:uncharacterized membrane protein (TIGR02234 family)